MLKKKNYVQLPISVASEFSIAMKHDDSSSFDRDPPRQVYLARPIENGNHLLAFSNSTVRFIAFSSYSIFKTLNILEIIKM